MSESRVRFGAFTLDLPARKLRRDGFVVPLPSRAVDALAYLVVHRHRAVAKDEVIAAVWKDVAVTDDSLTHAISVIRRTLGDDPTYPSYIETVPRRGYRFIGTVDAVDGPMQAMPVPEPAQSQTGGLTPHEAPRRSWRPIVATAALLLAIGALTLSWWRPGGTEAAIADGARRVQQAAPPGTSIVSNGVVSPAGGLLAFCRARGRNRKDGSVDPGV